MVEPLRHRQTKGAETDMLTHFAASGSGVRRLARLSEYPSPRRARATAKPGPPMTLANIRLNGVRMVAASCANCGRSADVSVDALPETLTVSEAGQRLRCSQCGAKTISTRPAWHTSQRLGHAGLSAQTDLLHFRCDQWRFWPRAWLKDG